MGQISQLKLADWGVRPKWGPEWRGWPQFDEFNSFMVNSLG